MKKIKVKKEDIKKAFEFNRKSESYKGQRTAVIRVPQDGGKAHLHYHEEGNYYPRKMENKPVHIRPELFIDPADRWIGYDENRRIMKDDGVEDEDEIEAGWEETKEAFWCGVSWLEELERPKKSSPEKAERLEGTEVEYIEEE